MSERLFLDTAFIQAILNQRDKYHAAARKVMPRVRTATEVWTTEAVLVEVGNALAGIDRSAASHFIRQCYQTKNMRIVPITAQLFEESVNLYESRIDKAWRLTDCISFVVMGNEGLHTAVTTDRHFVQAGFHALLIEPQ